VVHGAVKVNGKKVPLDVYIYVWKQELISCDR
jgi:hypothetical protein